MFVTIEQRHGPPRNLRSGVPFPMGMAAGIQGRQCVRAVTSGDLAWSLRALGAYDPKLYSVLHIVYEFST